MSMTKSEALAVIHARADAALADNYASMVRLAIDAIRNRLYFRLGPRGSPRDLTWDPRGGFEHTLSRLFAGSPRLGPFAAYSSSFLEEIEELLPPPPPMQAAAATSSASPPRAGHDNDDKPCAPSEEDQRLHEALAVVLNRTLVFRELELLAQLADEIGSASSFTCNSFSVGPAAVDTSDFLRETLDWKPQPPPWAPRFRAIVDEAVEAAKNGGSPP